jgi:hypothetical protein
MTKRERIAALEATVTSLTARVLELEARPHLVLKEKQPTLSWTTTTGTTGQQSSDLRLPSGVTIYGNSVGAQ